MASSCSPSAEIASLGSRPELSLCLLLSVSEELDVDNCCLNYKQKQSHIHTPGNPVTGEFWNESGRDGSWASLMKTCVT